MSRLRGMPALGGLSSRRLLIGGAAVACAVSAGLVAGTGADEGRSGRGTSAPSALARTKAVRRRVVFGRSAGGRALSMLGVGDPAAPRRVLVVGCIHGDETAGVPLVTALARGPAPSGFRLLLVGAVNPDGRAAGTRQNAHGVDLNRNFPFGWRPGGAPGDTYYPGPRPFSEPETRAIAALIRRERPTLTIWFHQHLDLVDLSGGDARVERRFARLIGERAVRLAPLTGTATRWQNHTFPPSTSFVVELPAGPLPPGQVTRIARAVRALGRG